MWRGLPSEDLAQARGLCVSAVGNVQFSTRMNIKAILYDVNLPAFRNLSHIVLPL